VSAPLPAALLPKAARAYGGFGAGEAPRVGLYRSYAASMDEGWTRWVFDTWKVPYLPLVDSVVQVGNLKEKFDIIVLPDQAPRAIGEGLPRTYPAPYPGGMAAEGAQALRQFVFDGGTLVALNEASRFAIQALLLPVRNVLEAVPQEDFYAPGSIFRLELTPDHPLTRNMPPTTVAWFEEGPAFDVLDTSVVRVVARYPSEPDRVLLSGWVLGPEKVAGKGALLEVRQGQGRVILFGFRPQYRGQSQATFPLFFNSLLLR